VSTIAHLINGELVQQTGRAPPSSTRPLGKPVREVALADQDTSAPPSTAPRPPSGLAQHPASQARPGDVPLQAAAGSQRDKIAQLISEEHGKTLEDAVGELQRGIENVEYACGVPSCSRASTAAMSAPHRQLERLPAAGRGGGHHPFNFPAMVPLWMYRWPLPAASLILKPSERDPSSTLLIAQLL
jgi:malonate-semialdehyde dehydrogenase (acetylating)/methylmalonate-semialdehyde dehydrogenase